MWKKVFLHGPFSDPGQLYLTWGAYDWDLIYPTFTTYIYNITSLTCKLVSCPIQQDSLAKFTPYSGPIHNAHTSIDVRQSAVRTLTMHTALEWRYNERDPVSHHRRLDCLPKRLFRRTSKKTSKLHINDIVKVIDRWPMNFPHKRPVTLIKLPFDGVIRKFSTFA